MFVLDFLNLVATDAHQAVNHANDFVTEDDTPDVLHTSLLPLLYDQPFGRWLPSTIAGFFSGSVGRN